MSRTWRSAAAGLLLGGCLLVGAPGPALAQDAAPAAEAPAPAPAASAPAKPAPVKKKVVKPAPPKPRPAAPAAQPPAAAAVPAPAAAPATGAAAPPDKPSTFAAGLQAKGVGTCAAAIDAAAARAMSNVTQFNTVANWATTDGDKRLASVSIGQKYADRAPVPFGATTVVAVPNGPKSCDTMAVQVVPSPLSCAKIRDGMAATAKQIGDLAGVPLMQDAGGQAMLVPTAADTCVIVGLRAAYTK